MASSQRPAQLAAHAPERQPPLALAEPAFPMSGHTFEVMDQEFNAWWTAYTCISPHMAMVAARRKQFLANLPQPERNLTVINDSMAHSPLGHS
jgi:hypothetical protein